ncbi:unnamed protein product [Peronospora destructor]|uniref:Uncharacterized protein n=1 Tax=Peronospora destructor TaxID=86335 RepID=A0AAV0V864_9STRA|nr:unnamed protein product [Peronospora destructor]
MDGKQDGEATVHPSEIPVTSMTTQARVATPKLPISSISTEILVKVPASLSTTETSVEEDPEETDMVMSTTQRSDGLPDSSLNNIKTDAPATAESITAGAVVKYPEEATVFPLLTPAVPAEEVGSVTSSSVTTSAGKTDETSTLPASIDSNDSNDIATISSASGSEGTNGTSIPEKLHASSSADVRLDESSKAADTKSFDSFHFQGAKMKKEASTTTEDHSAHCSTNCSKGDLMEKPSGDTTRSNDDGSSGLARGLINPGRVSDVSTSSALYYNMDTGSIVAIVGVIAGIVGLLMLFAAISRKKDTDEDDESPLRDGYNMEIRSIVQYLPTFLEDELSMKNGNNGTSFTVKAPTHQYDDMSSISGESSDEVPSLRGLMLVADQFGDINDLCRDGNVHTGNVRMSSLFSAGSSMTSDSEISCSWSSVLASDTENCSLRNTRDTLFSAWSATNLSPFGSTASSASECCLTRSFSTEYRQTGSSDISRFSPRLIKHFDLPDGSRVATGPVESRRSVDSTEM